MVTRDSLAKLFRFAIAGGLSTLLYMIFAFTLGAVFSMKFIYIHVAAFALAVPFSYFLQSGFTFQYKGSHKKSSWRFLMTTLTAFIVTTLVSFVLVDIWGMPQWIGIVTVAFIVPIISFISMRYWVFVDTRQTTET